ncbi:MULTISPECIES: peptidoglycan-binding protein [unclassified Streptomyces]|uniref:peptidoglycan-binding domain-containing protein n=1 Tax=unclassified Streptomyces TaxID=2593676 RepID=UPI0037A71684
MNSRTTRAKLAAGVVAALATGILAVGTPPAAATPSDGYVSGADGFGGDWGNEGKLSTTSYDDSNATCLWQKILWAEGKLAYEGIDGLFGMGTDKATKSLQGDWELSQDGEVGNDTFGRADNQLELDSWHVDTGYKLKYNGKVHDFVLYRNPAGNYRFYANGTYRLAGYHYNTCS